jgi:MFS family permease
MKNGMPEIASQDPVSPLPPPIEAYPAPVQGWSAAFVLSFLYILSLLDRNIMVLLSEPVARDLGLSDFQLSLLYGPGFALLFAIAGLPLGWAIDRYSRRVVIWSGVLFWSLATMACGLGRNFGELLTARAGVGVGEAALVPGSQSILADMFPPHAWHCRSPSTDLAERSVAGCHS